MNVLLIYVMTEHINMPVLPLGLGCLAASTMEAGHDVSQVTMTTQDFSWEHLRTEIESSSPQVIGISIRNIDDQNMSSPQVFLDSARDLISFCRSASSAPIVLGGAGFSIFPQSVLAAVGADFGIVGEGEASFVELLDCIEHDRDVAGIPGLFVAGKGLQGKRVYERNLENFPLPRPDIHLVCPPSLNRHELWVPYQTRRGCPMRCSYCSTGSIEGTVRRSHSPEKVVEALALYATAGYHRIFFVDNNFNIPASYAHSLCRKLISARLPLIWRCIFYPWKANRNLIKLMFDAGCREVSMGFESGSPSVLAAMNKRFSPEDIRTAAQLLGEQGIRRMGFLLLGGPGETPETIEESLAFAESLDLEMMRITAGIRIYPRTELARQARAEGMIESDDDLLTPRFYLNRSFSESWLRETLATWKSRHPNWII